MILLLLLLLGRRGRRSIMMGRLRLRLAISWSDL